jgi:hypothetical protein
MITFAPFPEALPTERPRLNWVPLVLLTTAAVALTTNAPGWARMWIIAIALFAGFKWWTWSKVVARDLRSRGEVANATPNANAITIAPHARRSRATPTTRSFAFLFLWPGMNARTFLYGAQAFVLRATCCPDARSAQEATPARTTASQWTWALAKTLLGATLLWLIARQFGHGLLAGWIGMIGFMFLLHFGLFALLSLFWQSRGIDAPPLMKCPIAANSLHDFWGRRWNAGFRDIVFVLFFFPLARRYGTRAAALATFVLSGLIHELVITIPAGGGYGLPTLYFALQGLGLMLERTRFRAACSLTRGWPGRLFATAVVTLPIAALFPPIFVTRVMVPFFQLIHAL